MSGKIYSLQLLRAIAVSLVIFIHVVNYVGLPHLQLHNNFRSFFHSATWGAIGVDLFFCISGFIMTIVVPSYQKNNLWKDFLYKRVIRIVPLYFLFSFYIYVIGITHDNPPTSESIIKTLVFLPIFDSSRFVVPILPVGWSLSYEVYFYLLIALFLNLRINIYKGLLGTIVILSTLGVVFNPTNVLLRFLTSPLLLEFGLGIIAGLLYKQKNPFKLLSHKRTAVVLCVGGAILMLTSLFTGSKNICEQEVVENDNLMALFRAVIWGVPSGLFLLGTVMLERFYKFKTAKIFLLLGDSSYSAYLIQVYVFQVFYIKLFSHGPMSGDMLVLSGIIVCLITSVLFYKFVEKPLTAVMSYISSLKMPVFMQKS